jgi:tetratricopeptide (TPR) repeat protein
MKQLLSGFFVFSIIASQNLFGQKMPSDFFAEGERYIDAKDYKRALVSFQYIVQHHPLNTLYPKAYYNVGYCYFRDNQSDSAIVVFKSILTGNFNEQEPTGGGIMDDPYANYRHRASGILSSIYYDKKMYDTALYYFSLSDTVYPYLHFCGNEYAESDVYTALGYADLYEKLGNKDKAVECLLSAIFITLADNYKVISELKRLLAGKKNLKKELDDALDKIYSTTVHRDTYSYNQYCFKFLQVEIPIPKSYEYEDETFNKNETVALIKKSSFYKMIAGL